MKKLIALTSLAVLALVGASVAIGASPGHKKAAARTTTTGVPRTPETPLTGDTLAKASAAAVAKVGGTADFASTETDGTNSAAAYEVHMTKADGTHVTVIEDSSFAVLSVETGGPGGAGLRGPGPHGPGPGNGETPLTGDTATKAEAAAVAKVGGTADVATTETDSSNSAAAYEVHVTKADGTHVSVVEDKNFNVLSVETGPQGAPGGPPGWHRP